jgi:hypothetical protein
MATRRKRTVNEPQATANEPQTAVQPAADGIVATECEIVDGYESVRRLVTPNGVYYGIPDPENGNCYRCLREDEWNAFQRILDDLASFLTISRELAFRCRVTDFGGVVTVRLGEGGDD